MRRFSILAGAAFLVLSAVGCDAKTYFKDRGHDFLDMVSVDVAGGAGVGLHGKAAIFNTGLGYGQMVHAGLMENPGGHNGFGVRPEVQSDVIVRTNSGQMKAGSSPWTGPFEMSWLKSADRMNNHKCWFIHVPGMKADSAEPDLKWWDALDMELSANALVVGARAGARPGQAFDFVLGWFTVDFVGDDCANCAACKAKK
jgi:hypothetical protein